MKCIHSYVQFFSKSNIEKTLKSINIWRSYREK